MTADQLTGVNSIAAYFNAQTSSLNPLNYGSYTYGMFPLFFTWMVAEWFKMTSFDAITLAGRAMSGLFDLAAVWMLYLLGKRLYDRRIGLLAAALGAAAVLPIQLSHYFAVDSFSTVFVVASFYFAILAIPIKFPEERPSYRNLIYFGLFGLVVGLAVACKVNTLPVFGIIGLAGLAEIITNWKKTGFAQLLKVIFLGWVLAGFFAFLAFRVFQPYAFAGPGFFGIRLNQDWLKVIQDVTNQVAGKSDWPPNTHWTNRSIFYAWTNIVTWGLGLPLGLAGWLGWGWAAWRNSGKETGAGICCHSSGWALILSGKMSSFGAICVTSCQFIRSSSCLPPGHWWKFTTLLVKAAPACWQMEPSLCCNSLDWRRTWKGCWWAYWHLGSS